MPVVVALPQVARRAAGMPVVVAVAAGALANWQWPQSPAVALAD
jgi:hypothetical protein